MSYLEDLKDTASVTTTENGAKTYDTTLNANLDFYSQAGAMRTRLGDVDVMFAKAFSENPELALRNLVHLRNIRLGGLGERGAYLEAFKVLVNTRKETLVKVMMDYTAYIGRWSDLMDIIEYGHKLSIHFVERHGAAIIAKQLDEDIDKYKAGESVSLLAKWIPNVSSPTARKRRLAKLLTELLDVDGKDYRAGIVTLRDYLNLIEVRLASKEYEKIDLNQVPSKALFKYRKALERHLPEDYEALMTSVEKGETKLKTSSMYPYEILQAYNADPGWGAIDMDRLNRHLENTWDSLDDVIKDIKDNALVMADTSISMRGMPFCVSVSLAIYCAERLEGEFKGHFLTFSEKPTLQTIPLNGSLRDKVRSMKSINCSNTDLQSAFRLLLKAAVDHRTPQEEMPNKVIVISDMEFDRAGGFTNYQAIQKQYADAGYEAPSIVFWNVDSRQDNVPVRHDENGIALVSGLTPNIFKQVLGGKITTPEEMMLDTLNKPEYDFVKEALK